MTGWFKKPIEKVDDLKGLKMRIPGLPDGCTSSSALTCACCRPAKIFPALERGVIDAAEFVGPYLDRQLGLHRAAKYYYTTGWHETATSSELIINKAKWNGLPRISKRLSKTPAPPATSSARRGARRTMPEAMQDLIKNQGVTARPLPDTVVEALREANTKSSRRQSPRIR